MKPSGLEALMAFMNSDIGQLLRNIIVKEIVPFAKQKLIDGALNPVVMTPEEQAARAEKEFATVEMPEEKPEEQQQQPEPQQKAKNNTSDLGY